MRFAKAYVEITNICNRNCSFCPKTNRKPAQMTPEQFAIIAEKLRPVTDYLYLHLMGEPLLHPQLQTLLEIARTLGFRVILTTNGTLLGKAQPVLLAAPALHKVNISLHSFEANEAGEFSAYLQDCISFARLAAAQRILINFRLWNLDGTETTGRNTQNEAILAALHAAFPEDWSASRSGMRMTDRVYLSYGETFAWPSMEERDRGETRFCYGLKDQIGVLADGTVVPCCLDHEGDIPLGNLLQQDIEQILNAPRTGAMIEGFRQNRAVEPLCRRCGYSTRFLK